MVLQEASYPIISDEQCMQMYDGTGIPVFAEDICALQPGGGIDSCHGDSGKPWLHYLMAHLTQFHSLHV